MTNIENPVIPGMAPDPSIIRVGDDYYIATSTFHWTPAVQLFHSRDLTNWELIGYALADTPIDLRGTNTPAGIWAPHLSYDESTGRFWLAYSHMLNMAGREFCADSFAIWSENIQGPWSDPIYLTSIGFDISLFHDDGAHYAAILEWESRQGYRHSGHMVIAQADLDNGGIVGTWHRVTQGFTTRGAAEAPQLYKHDGYYYLFIAAGGHGLRTRRGGWAFPQCVWTVRASPLRGAHHHLLTTTPRLARGPGRWSIRHVQPGFGHAEGGSRFAGPDSRR